MAVRGSGIGASWGAASQNQGGGRGQTPTQQATYPNIGFAGVQSTSFSGAPSFLLLLVAAEVAAIVALRHGFRHHHGG